MESECDYVNAVAAGAGKLTVVCDEKGITIYNYMLMHKIDAHNSDLYRLGKNMDSECDHFYAINLL